MSTAVASSEGPYGKITQPLVNLSTANAQPIARFAQSQEMTELANANALKYLELAQKTFGGMAAGEGRAELVRRLTEDCSTFARKHALSLMRIVAEGQMQLVQQVPAATGRLTEGAQASAATVEEASKPAERTRAE
jgi:hypothetical protein